MSETTRKETVQERNQREVFERFCRDVGPWDDTVGRGPHQMTILHEDGLYRHVRFRKADTGRYWFDLVTWPGSLTINGEMGTYTFSRVQDMFIFFRGDRINPSYWSEKIRGDGGGRDIGTCYSEELFRELLERKLAEYEEHYGSIVESYDSALAAYEAAPYDQRYPWTGNGLREPREPKTMDEVREIVEQLGVALGELSFEDGARRLLAELESAGVVADTWEWSLRDYSPHFLWCCHAIQWGIRVYDQAKATALVAEGVTAPDA